jgi:hypothetical protein
MVLYYIAFYRYSSLKLNIQYYSRYSRGVKKFISPLIGNSLFFRPGIGVFAGIFVIRAFCGVWQRVMVFYQFFE